MEYKVLHSMPVREALTHMYPDSSRRSLQNWLSAGRFSVNGRVLKRENELLREGDVLSAKTTCKKSPIPGIEILYEDRYLVAIDKPEGLLSVPLDDQGQLHNHALGLLRTHLETSALFAVHRLDRDVSGVLLFARGTEAEQRLKDIFEKHDLCRQYFAIVEGRLQQDQGTWIHRLLELPNFDVIPSPEGKEAVTHFKVHRRSKKYSYLHLTLETGKKHQIRVHCQTAGHPILGDARYGSTENPLGRICLHAVSLELKHPFTKKPIRITSSLPKSFNVVGGQV